ncbi:hypothetical protein [Streptomyces microflavus]|uniref:hypothetical protein n=1 Tax=Streptomyces microflavus TaxID=1919 RepID=UPI0033ADCEDE
MDLHTWITQQVDEVERLIEEGEYPPSQDDGVRRRCEADRRILARHRLDPSITYEPACHGCGTYGDLDLSNTDNLNDCPELLDLAHAHGITPDVLSGLDPPKAPEQKPHGPVDPVLAGIFARALGLPTPPITTSDVPEALRGPRWKP